ncbi:MAG: lipid-A-disaccharide synthase [Pseudomonadota bacterium]
MGEGTPQDAVEKPVIFVVAAEPSGDALGGPILRALESQAPGRYRYIGVGGEQMQAAGLETLFPMADITAFGLTEVVPRIPQILNRLNQVVNAAHRLKPALLLTIDGPDFSFRVARKAQDLACPKVHVVAPTVWAWRPKRAAKIAKLYDHLLCLFPFEPPYFEKEGLPTSFIGHPLVTGPASQADPAGFKARHQLTDDQKTLITVLPGSRRSEVTRLAPVFGEALGQLRDQLGPVQAVIPTVNAVAALVREHTKPWPVPVTITQDADEKYHAMASGQVALAASGTVSLELALTRTPAVIAYRANALSAAIFRRMAITKYVGLPNVILDRPLIAECLQEHCTPGRLSQEMLRLIRDQKAREAVLDGYESVAQQLGQGRLQPAQMAADRLLSLVIG